MKREFLEHGKEEEEHLHALAERINQLDGKPNLNDPISVIDRVEPVNRRIWRARGSTSDLSPRALHAKRAALRAFTSQQDGVLGPAILLTHVLDRFARPFEVLLR